MMNNSYNPQGLPQQHNVQTSHAPPQLLQQSPPTAAAISYLQQQQQPQIHGQHLSQLSAQQQQQLAAAMAHSTHPLFDPRQLQAATAVTSAGLDKSYYAGATATVAANTAAARFYTTSAGATAHHHHHPNTILITNNFPQQQLATTEQQHQQQQRAALAGNIRIVSAAPNMLHQHVATNTPQQHVYNINKETMQQPHDAQQQLYQQQLQHFAAQQQQQQQQQIAALLPQHFTQHHAMHLQLPTTAHAQHYYLPATEAAAINSTAKIMPSIASAAGTVQSATTVATENTAAATVAVAGTNAPPAATSSTVVLDRINICINNHYSDATNATSGIGSPANTVATLASPIIPAIQHKAVVDSASGLLIDPYACSSNESSASTTLVIDEPDSTTTTPHTPPTTPETSSPITTATTAATVQSPSTSTTTATDAKHSFAIVAHTIEEVAASVSNKNIVSEQHLQSETLVMQQVQQPVPLTPLTPPSPQPPPTPPTPPTPAATITFIIGEDVFIKRHDGRFYLGTIIDSARQQFLVRFDDKSELWCSADEMRRLGGGSSSATANEAAVDSGQMCVACKRAQLDDVVEICERCCRGYHRNCTTETSPGSGEWLCKRCAKPMKVLKTNYNCNNIETKQYSVCRQLPYHVDTLNWDEKHRVNEEQIYCYCGKTGKFDHNMLQCCKCSNWFHTHCMQHFQSTILRGDGFFVFCCSVCNDGKEFLRRLQMSWVDLMHLTLYNLSAMKKHQHQKYHHLKNDIGPFLLEKRDVLPIPKEWIEMSEAEFMDKIKSTLKDNTDRFICGREIKRDHAYYALRNNGPPILPKFNASVDDVLTEELLSHTWKLILLHGAPENVYPLKTSELPTVAVCNVPTSNESTFKSKLTQEAKLNDVYEFRIEDDEKFTSDDEIPIKHILEKVKKTKLVPTMDKTLIKSIIKKSPSIPEKINVDDENANDSNICNIIRTAKKSPQKNIDIKQTTQSDSIDGSIKLISDKIPATQVVEDIPMAVIVPQKTSRKRKAFTHSKSYKEIADEAAAKRYDSSRICDSSSDENSSSSRGTSLDLIIPPPENFLGLNNPFRIVTPKKSSTGVASNGGSKKSVSFSRKNGNVITNSIFNTTTLDFSSKLAALKSAGIFPNLSTSNLAKAAGQPRTVRTIKRRLSAKDITIGPNQEVRRRRTRRLSANIEVISTTTIHHPIPSNFFPIHAKDLINSSTTTYITNQKLNQHILLGPPTPSSASSSPPASTTSSIDSLPTTAAGRQAMDIATVTTQQQIPPPTKPTHGRRLRTRPQKSSPTTSRRSSISGASSSSNQSNLSAAMAAAANALQAATPNDTSMLDLKTSVNKYFGAANRIESGEQFSIRAKRKLANGHSQYLIEWGDATVNAASSITA